MESYSCMEKKYKSNQLNESQVTLFYQSWNYLQKIKVDVFVERHLKITTNSFHFVPFLGDFRGSSGRDWWHYGTFHWVLHP